MTNSGKLTITRTDLLNGLTKARLLTIAEFVGLWDQENASRTDLYDKLLSSRLYETELLVDLLQPKEIRALCDKFRLINGRSNQDDKYKAVRVAVGSLKRARNLQPSFTNETVVMSERPTPVDLLRKMTKERIAVLASRLGVELNKRATKETLIDRVIDPDRFTINVLFNLLTLPELRKIADRYEVPVTGRRKEHFISTPQNLFEGDRRKTTPSIKNGRQVKPRVPDTEIPIIEDKYDNEICAHAEQFRWRCRPHCPFCGCNLKDEHTFVRHVTNKCPKLHGHDAYQLSNGAKKTALDILRSKVDFEATKIAKSNGNKRPPSKLSRKTVAKRRKKKKPKKEYTGSGLFSDRILPPRITSMVSGGLPGLGRKR